MDIEDLVLISGTKLDCPKEDVFKHTLSIDIETYCEVDIGKCGAYRYVDDDSFEVLLFAYSIDFAPAKVVDLACGEQIPQEILDAMYSWKYLKTAYNAPFERVSLSKWLGKPLITAQWECDMVLGASCGLPLGLANITSALEFSDDKAKMKVGKELIKYFCVPCKPTQVNGGRTRNLPEHDMEKWELFKQYNARDVDAENEVRKRLLPYRPNIEEHYNWCLDQIINDNGVKIDMDLVNNAIAFDDKAKEVLLNEAIELSGLENPQSVSQVKDWLEQKEGIEIDSLNKKSMPDVVANLKEEESLRLLKLRNELSKTSVSKYKAMDNCVCSDGRARGLFQFYGTRTGRFAGRLIQLQNLPQNHLPDIETARELVRAGLYEDMETLFDNVSSTLSELIRTAIVPTPGYKFIVCDFSAIEARVIAWFAKEEWRLDVFRNGGDIYCASATQMFKVPVEKHGRNAELRQKGKIAELALGYGGSVGALKAFGADKMGMSEEEMKETVTLWREASPHIVSWWWSVDRAAKRAIKNRGEAYDEIGGVLFSYENGLLFVTLPSGRRLCYYNAHIKEGRFGKPVVGYYGMNQQTRKFEVQETYGPKIVENIVQGTARDCLTISMQRLYKAGFKMVMHVHDEIICEEPIGGKSYEEMEHLMSLPIEWAKGLPLKGDGDELKFYQKA